MTSSPLRWKQRFHSYSSALERLRDAVELARQRPLSDLEKQGLIQAFEFTHELAWNVMRDFFIHQGATLISGSRDATREAIQKGLVQEAEDWMEMIKSRNQTSHTYNLKVANEIAERILSRYFLCFTSFHQMMSSLGQSE